MPRVVKEKKKLVDNPFAWVALITSGIILALLAFLVAFQDQLFEGNVLAIVNNENITEQDLNDQIYGIDFQGTASEPLEIDNETKKEILDNLVEWKIAEIEAEKMGLSVSEDEIDEKIEKSIDGRFDSYTAFQRELTRENVEKNLFLEKVKENAVGWREADFFLARFDQSYELGLDADDTQVKERIASEKEYAKNLADSLYEDIKEGTMNFAEAQEKILADTKIGKIGWNNTTSYTFAGKVFKDQSITKGLFHGATSFWDKIFELSKGDLSEPFIVTLDDQNYGNHEALYAVVGVTDSNSSDYKTYEEWFSAKKDEYKVEYKVTY